MYLTGAFGSSSVLQAMNSLKALQAQQASVPPAGTQPPTTQPAPFVPPWQKPSDVPLPQGPPGTVPPVYLVDPSAGFFERHRTHILLGVGGALTIGILWFGVRARFQRARSGA
jgi:hypothetical protein